MKAVHDERRQRKDVLMSGIITAIGEHACAACIVPELQPHVCTGKGAKPSAAHLIVVTECNAALVLQAFHFTISQKELQSSWHL